MNQGQSRIPCPRCRANNFLGQTHCWQCGGSLPPPEAMGQAVAPAGYTPPQQGGYPAMPPTQYGAPNIPPAQNYYPSPYGDMIPARRASRWLTVAPILLLLVMILGGLFLFAFRSRSRSLVPGMDEAQKAVNDYTNRLRREMNASTSDSNASDTDPLNAQARREIDRLSGQIGGMAPPTDPNGNVHLRSGGTITREEYERYRDSLRANP